MKRWIAWLDPVRWPEFLFWAVAATVVIGWPVLMEWGVWIPAWIVLPLIGTLFWRAEGVEWRDVVASVLPIALLLLLSDLFLPAGIQVVADLAILFVACAVFIVSPLKRAWLGFLAPGHYRVLPAGDDALANKFRDLASALRRAQERLAATGDDARFARAVAANRRDAARVPIADADWEEVRRLWLHYLDWFEGKETDSSATDDEIDELNRRGDNAAQALRALLQRRSYYLGSKQSI